MMNLYTNNTHRNLTASNEKVTFFFLNIRSLSKNVDELVAYTNTFSVKPAIVALAETWLKANDDTSVYTLPGYNPGIFQK